VIIKVDPQALRIHDVVAARFGKASSRDASPRRREEADTAATGAPMRADDRRSRLCNRRLAKTAAHQAAATSTDEATDRRAAVSTRQVARWPAKPSTKAAAKLAPAADERVAARHRAGSATGDIVVAG
jgi:hypothetical protein